jgi:hypothetical protein
VNDPAAASSRQLGIVGEGCSGTDQDRIGPFAQTVNCGSRRLPADPSRFTRGRGDAAVEGARQFEAHEGATVLAEGNEAPVELATLAPQHAHDDLDAATAQPPHAPAGNFGVGIDVSDEDAPDAGLEDRFGARTGASDVTARLEGHREGRPAKRTRSVAAGGAAERHDFGVGATDGPRIATAEDAIAAVHHRADTGIRMGPPPSLPALGHGQTHGSFGAH